VQLTLVTLRCGCGPTAQIVTASRQVRLSYVIQQTIPEPRCRSSKCSVTKRTLVCNQQPVKKVKVKVWVLVIALLTKLEQQHFTISEVAADWHGLMILWCIMRPSIARDGEQLANSVRVSAECNRLTLASAMSRSRQSSLTASLSQEAQGM